MLHPENFEDTAFLKLVCGWLSNNQNPPMVAFGAPMPLKLFQNITLCSFWVGYCFGWVGHCFGSGWLVHYFECN